MASRPAPANLPGAPVTARRLTRAEMPAAARLHRAALDDRLPWLAGRHTAAEDTAYFDGTVFAAGPMWGAFDGTALVGIIALGNCVIDQLHVDPTYQSRGIGSLLVDFAKGEAETLILWTFARNTGARAFYERHGFIAIEFTDGSRNAEREPDVRYRWQAS